MVIAALSAWHEEHERAATALADTQVLPAHVMLEAYSVLTRLPSGLAVSRTDAAEVLGRRFSQPPLQIAESDRGSLLETLAEAGIAGGASYDALVALEAHAHGRALLSLDQRAQETYRRLQIDFRVV